MKPDMAHLANNLMGRRLSVRVEDHLDILDDLTGKVVRVATGHDCGLRLDEEDLIPLVILVELDSSTRISTDYMLPPGTFRYIVLVVWDLSKLTDFSERVDTTLDRGIHLYLLNEELLRQAGISPEHDRLDVRMTYGISKDVEVRLL